MDDQRWRQIEDVYLAALDAPDRTAFLTDTCRDDPELRAAVDLLLTQEPSTISLIGRLALHGLVTTAEAAADREPLAPDSQLGSYRIVELLGSGGSSDVYKAYDIRLHRHVALKVFDGRRVTEEFRQRFARESRSAASLNHPNIATVYEVGEAERAWFIAMEFVDGRTLRDAFKEPTCSLRQRLEWLAQAASGIARAHANGLAHCDLKPDNIMVTRDGLVKVLDFGLARLAGSSEASGRRLEGTIGYMSPEQAAGKTIDVRSDVFSFGCMLFEAVTDTRPFPAERWFDSLMHAAQPRLETLTHRVPDGVQALVDDCLVKDPDKRLASLDQVSQRLQSILGAQSRVNHWMLGAVAIVLLLIPAVAYWQWPAPPPAGSVAVIPFATVEATADARRLADGISEGVINVLAQLPDLKVIARSSSFRFAGDSLDAPMVARALGVQTLVTGRIANTNGQLTISAELVSGRDGTAMWRQSYTPSLDHVMDVEGQIAREIARRVRSELTAADRRRLDKAVHPNSDVYSLLLRGRFEMQLYTLPSALSAKSYFEQALGIDPAYALGNAELANAYLRLASNGGLEPAEALQRGEQVARKAIAIDDEVPEAHAALANILRNKWQWADAQREYRRAIGLSPSFGPARQGLAIALTLTGERDEAIAEITRARELDPVGLPGAVESAAVFYNLRLYDRALAALNDGLAIDSRGAVLYQWLGIVNGGRGDFGGAVAALEKAMALGYNTPATRSYYVHALARAGRRDEAGRQLRALESDGSVVAPSFVAIAYLGLGDRERAITHLQAGYEARDPLLQYIVVESFLDDVMDDRRFQKIVDGMGLPRPRRP
jgi:TolB-like protein/tRNA A-37 threonylcarbamoyl transferase component Bud32/tetratricopeptide (TPR) repeat protein